VLVSQHSVKIIIEYWYVRLTVWSKKLLCTIKIMSDGN